MRQIVVFAVPLICGCGDRLHATHHNETIEIEDGWFWRGCDVDRDPDCFLWELPYRRIRLDPYGIDAFEVTVGEYRRCVEDGGCSEPYEESCPIPHEFEDNPGYEDIEFEANWELEGRENHPMNCVEWQQAVDYCDWMGQRLPTEAEWERAARGVDGQTYPWGEARPDCGLAIMWADDTAAGCDQLTTARVGARPTGVSPVGAHDMSGNVSEWTADWYDPSYYDYSPDENPPGPDQAPSGSRTIRGGAFYHSNYYSRSLRASGRRPAAPSGASVSIGFRCATNL